MSGHLHAPVAIIGGWVDPRTGLDGAERTNTLPSPGLDHPTRSQSLYRLRYPGSRDVWDTSHNVRIWVITPVVMMSSILRDITPCSPLEVNRRFGGTNRLRATCFMLISCLPYSSTKRTEHCALFLVT
jgi:hypothetical protein